MIKGRADAILNRLENINNPKVAELGVLYGKTSRSLLEGHKTLQLYMIDTWDDFKDYDFIEYYKTTKDKSILSDNEQRKKEYEQVKNICNQYRDRTKIIKNYTHKAVFLFKDDYFDLVFIDADHSYEGCKRDIIEWLPKVKQNGWIGGHDFGYKPDIFGVDRAVKDLFNDKYEEDWNFTWWHRVCK